MAIKRDAKDAAFSDAIRERAKWRCEHCARDCSNGNGQLDCAHIYGRRDRTTRWFPLNAVALCNPCHRKFTEHPLDFASWIAKHLGAGALQILYERKQLTMRYRAKDLKAIARHYRQEAKRLAALPVGVERILVGFD